MNPSDLDTSVSGYDFHYDDVSRSNLHGSGDLQPPGAMVKNQSMSKSVSKSKSKRSRTTKEKSQNSKKKENKKSGKKKKIRSIFSRSKHKRNAKNFKAE